jgi:cation:H+ antiporter
VVAVGTSLPELATAIAAAYRREVNLLLGNVIGSNIFNIGLVGGVAGILGPISTTTSFPWIDYISLLILTGVLIIWLKGKQLKKMHGIFLLSCYLLASLATWMLNS